MRTDTWRRWLARTLPGALLIATFADDLIFGGVIIGARLNFGTVGLVAASLAFVLLSIGMAAATAWALRCEPLRLSDRNRRRIGRLQRRRLGRYLLPHHERPLSTAIAAAAFGSVAPLIVAAADPAHTPASTIRLVVPSGLAYGVAFATGYGLLGALAGTVV